MQCNCVIKDNVFNAPHSAALSDLRETVENTSLSSRDEISVSVHNNERKIMKGRIVMDELNLVI